MNVEVEACVRRETSREARLAAVCACLNTDDAQKRSTALRTAISLGLGRELDCIVDAMPQVCMRYLIAVGTIDQDAVDRAVECLRRAIASNDGTCATVARLLDQFLHKSFDSFWRREHVPTIVAAMLHSDPVRCLRFMKGMPQSWVQCPMEHTLLPMLGAVVDRTPNTQASRVVMILKSMGFGGACVDAASAQIAQRVMQRLQQGRNNSQFSAEDFSVACNALISVEYSSTELLRILVRFLDNIDYAAVALQAIGHACTRCPLPQDVVEAVVHLGANSLTGELALDPEFVYARKRALQTMQLFPRNVIVPRSLIAPIVRVVQTRLTMNEVLSCLSWLRRFDHLGEHAEALSRLCSKQLMDKMIPFTGNMCPEMVTQSRKLVVRTLMRVLLHAHALSESVATLLPKDPAWFAEGVDAIGLAVESLRERSATNIAEHHAMLVSLLRAQWCAAARRVLLKQPPELIVQDGDAMLALYSMRAGEAERDGAAAAAEVLVHAESALLPPSWRGRQGLRRLGSSGGVLFREAERSFENARELMATKPP